MLTIALVLAAAAAAPSSSLPTCALPDGTRVRLELALSDAEKANGLMFRDSLPADHGMLFIFVVDGKYPFWMKNTFIPLDMVWLTATGQVVSVRTVQPCRADPCPSYEPAGPVRAVLELNAGAAGAHGVKPGAVLRFADVPGFPPPGGKR